ncbi:MAG: hypothetical protein IIB38_04450, partial [Candidatus Hydrogenedentes bacterium]|nr:hypothetical protein [Candidatus Hydrogenedentota bacterium]
MTLSEQAVTFGKTLITGNSVIPASSIMREVAYDQGKSWDKGKIETTLKRLRELDVFESVQIYPSRDVDDTLQKPIFVKLIDVQHLLIIHFDSFSGIDFLGSKWEVYGILLSGIFLNLINGFLVTVFYYRERLLSYLLAFSNL